MPAASIVDFSSKDEDADCELVTVGTEAMKRSAAADNINPAPQGPTIFWVEIPVPAKSTPTTPVANRPTIQSQRPTVDLEKVKAGVSLRHKAFGLGVVTKFKDSFIFVDIDGNKKGFLFPAALLEGYLGWE